MIDPGFGPLVIGVAGGIAGGGCVLAFLRQRLERQERAVAHMGRLLAEALKRSDEFLDELLGVAVPDETPPIVAGFVGSDGNPVE